MSQSCDGLVHHSDCNADVTQDLNEFKSAIKHFDLARTYDRGNCDAVLGYAYLLTTSGMGFFRSTNDCNTFTHCPSLHVDLLSISGHVRKAVQELSSYLDASPLKHDDRVDL